MYVTLKTDLAEKIINLDTDKIKSIFNLLFPSYDDILFEEIARRSREFIYNSIINITRNFKKIYINNCHFTAISLSQWDTDILSIPTFKLYHCIFQKNDTCIYQAMRDLDTIFYNVIPEKSLIISRILAKDTREFYQSLLASTQVYSYYVTDNLIIMRADPIELLARLQRTISTKPIHKNYNIIVSTVNLGRSLAYKVGMLLKENFAGSHFFNDPRIPTEKAREIYYKWGVTSAHKTSQNYIKVLAISNNNDVVGYASFKLENVANIKVIVLELIVVDNNVKGKGIALQLVEKGLNYIFEIAQNNIKYIYVGTWSNNTRALSFYEKIGFRISKTLVTLHIWKLNQNKLHLR